MYQRKVDVDMVNAVKSVLAGMCSVAAVVPYDSILLSSGRRSVLL